MFESYLRAQGLEARGGQIIDATLVPVPQPQASAQQQQWNSREDKKEIKEYRMPEGWDQNPNRLQQKDLDARWTQKNDINHFGYKNNICIDVDHGLMRCYALTLANRHDSQILPIPLDPQHTDDYF